MSRQRREPEEGFDKSFSNFVVIDGIPVIDQKREAKLRDVLLSKVFTQCCPIKSLEIPFDEQTKTSLGFCFLECESIEDVDKLVKVTNGYKLDEKHTFTANKWSDFELIEQVPATYTAPTFEEPIFPHVNIQEWLLDPLGCDQFATLDENDNQTEIMLNNVGGEKPSLLIRRAEWTDKWVCWSSRGSYFATVHVPGVVIWGGNGFEKLCRYPHHEVDWMEFSPSEKYLVTYSSKSPENEAFVVWDVLTGERLRAFPRGNSKIFSPLQWSANDKYFARLNDGLVSVYETPSCTLLDKSSIKLTKDIASFKWSPTDSTMACYVPEVPSSQSPARVVLLSIPSRRELAQKILYGVTDCKMHWHPNGDFLSVEINISQSKGKKSYTSFELFLIREKGIPIDNLKIEDTCIGFEWEPRGKRFGVIHSEDSSVTRNSVSFYSMEPKQVKLITTLEKRQTNELHWSPAGRFVVLAGIRNPNGIFEFYDLDEKETLANETHPMTTDVAWDPTGRYFVTYVSFWKEKVENGYIMWSFAGQKLVHQAKSKFCQFVWRPRPPTLLTKEVESNIEKNIKSISETYKKEDEVKRKKLQEDKKAHKLALLTEFEKYLQARHAEWVAQTETRRKMRNGYISDDEDDWHEVEVWEDLIVDEKQEILTE